MNLIATDTGRVLQLLIMEEIIPSSGIYMPNLYQQLADRYAFVGRPNNYVEAVANGTKFQHGRLATPTKTIVIKEIGIYNDGVIIDAMNTDDAEYVMEDFIVWVTAAFALRPIKTEIPRIYSSIVTIEFESAIECALRGLDIVLTQVSAALNNAYGWQHEVHLLRLAVNADPQAVPPLRNTQFYIERRIGRPYSQNRYQSGGPLRTEDHLALLTGIETDLMMAQPAQDICR
jgi:hypothetical protein